MKLELQGHGHSQARARERGNAEARERGGWSKSKSKREGAPSCHMSQVTRHLLSHNAFLVSSSVRKVAYFWVVA